MRRILAWQLLLVLLLSGCGSPQPPAGRASAAPSQASSVRTVERTVAVTPEVASSPRQMPAHASTPGVASPVGFACRLPVTVAGRRAFISFPSGAVENAGPAQSTESDSYSWTLGRWSVHGLSSFSPDGNSYAWSEFGRDGGQPTRQHVTDARTGLDRVVHEGDFLAVLAWSMNGIYLSETRGEGSKGLYLMDPTGSVRQLDPSGGYLAVAGGGAWRMGDSAYGPQYELTRRDLQSGVTQSWYLTVSSVNSLRLLGFAADGHPIVLLYRYPSSDSLVSVIYGPNQARQLYQGTDRIGGTIFLDKFASVSDSRGTWIQGQDGLWLFDGGFRRVLSGSAVRPAGECR